MPRILGWGDLGSPDHAPHRGVEAGAGQVPLYDAQALLGHQDYATTQRC